MGRAESQAAVLVDEDGNISVPASLQIRSILFMNSYCPGPGLSNAVTGTGS
jgi:hypothetical protein